MMFDHMKFDRTTVTNKIVAEIKKMIYENKLNPGAKLPSERELAQQLNVSRNTVRESFKILATLGFIEIRQGHGVFVTDGSDNLAQFTSRYFLKSDQFTDLFEIRRLIETQSVVWTVERASDTEIEHFHQFVTETVHLIQEDKLDKVAMAEKDKHFHEKLAELSTNAVAYRIMRSLTGLYDKVHKETSRIPDRMSHSWKEHMKIADMIKKRDAVKARTYMEKHLDSVERALHAERGAVYDR